MAKVAAEAQERTIDITCFDDYDRVIRFLFDKDIQAVRRDKLEMVVVANLTDEQFAELQKLPFDDFVLC